MSLELAREGAHVLGVDLSEDGIRWAKTHVGTREVSGSLTFVCRDVRTMALAGYDLIVSKDTFEHIQDLGSMLVALRGCLAPGGQIWTGFSPLFYSPGGIHGEMGVNLPWAHVLSRRLVYAAASRRRGASVASLADLGLNGMTPSEFRRDVAEAGLRFESLSYNVSDRGLMSVLSWMRRVPFLERYATVSIYAVLAPS